MEVIIAFGIITIILGSLIVFYFLIRQNPKKFVPAPRRRRKSRKKNNWSTHQESNLDRKFRRLL